jgi:outer membrane protein OmpA-like peptidoglycan-associated protein
MPRYKMVLPFLSTSCLLTPLASSLEQAAFTTPRVYERIAVTALREGDGRTLESDGPESASAVAPSPRYDLNGEWEANVTAPPRIVTEKLAIQQISTKVTATKVTGDEYVPAGKVSLRANYTANPFQGEVQCAFPGYRNPYWRPVTLTVIDATHLKLKGPSCNPQSAPYDVVWERIGKPTMALDNTLLFDADKFGLKPEAASMLEVIKRQLETQHPNTRLLVAGYTDNVGSDAHNLQLSTRRAQSVATWLGENGITKSLLSVKGFGKANPRYPNTNDEARAHNRRVEIVILE